MSQQHSSQFQGLSLDQIFSDLASRFVVNMPADELASIERICFQVEQCHWFYEDFVQPQRPDLPALNLRNFSELFLIKCSPHLSAFSFNPKAAYDAFVRYKSAIPVRGAVLVNPAWDKVVLVKGWKSSAGWGFPKGKINKNESDRDCAVREVWEEIGYDISPHFAPSRRPYTDQNGAPPPLGDAVEVEDDYLDLNVQGQHLRIFVVLNVQEDAVFVTRTRKEISKIAWFDLKELPGWSKKQNASPVTAVTCFNANGAAETISTSRFYLVMPIIRSLKSWMNKHKSQRQNQQKATPVQQYQEEAAFSDLSAASEALQAFFLSPQANPSPPTAPSSLEVQADVMDSAPDSLPSSSSPTVEDRANMRKKLLFDLDALATPPVRTHVQPPILPPPILPPMILPPMLGPHHNGVDHLFRNASMAQPSAAGPFPCFVPQAPPPPASMALYASGVPHYVQPQQFGPTNISQPTPIRPIPLLTLQSPHPLPTKLPPQQTAALLDLLNIKPAL